MSQVTYRDGGKPRSILYQGHLSELFVPYMDPTMGWRDRAYLDFGEAAGGLATPMEPGLDCPSYARLFDTVVMDGQGIPKRVHRAAALFEIDPGAMSWRHWDSLASHTESRSRRLLVLRMIATLGNYDYVFDWTVLKHQQDEEKERQTSGVSRSSGREREGRDRGRDRDAGGSREQMRGSMPPQRGASRDAGMSRERHR